MTSVRRRSAEAAVWALALGAVTLPAGAARAELRIAGAVDWLVQGLFCAPPETGRRDAPDTLSGWVHVPDRPVEMVAEGVVAPAILGMGFGVRYQRASNTDAGIRYVVTHPAMGAAGTTQQSWNSLSMAGEVDAIFFQFDTAEELVTGAWAFQAFDGTKELFHVPFTVVPGESMPEATGLCRPGTLLSMAVPSPGSG